jgi:hypothetical protein
MSNTSILRELLKDLSVPVERWKYFQEIINRKIDPYKSVDMRKRDGRSSRVISVPEASLRKLQSEILKYVEKKTSAHLYANSYAYVKGKSHAGAAEIHLGMTWGIKVDISKFFDHVTETHVRKALERAGLGEQADVLAKLCTRVELNWPNGLPPKYSRFKRAIGNYDLRSGTAKYYRGILREYPFLIRRSQRGRHGLGRNGREVLIVMPPKRLPRLFPASPSSYRSPDQNRLWKIFRRKTLQYVHRDELPDFPNGQTRRYWKEEVAFSRWSLRKKILSFYTNSHKFSKLIGSPIHRLYPVAPSQYRLRFREGRLPQGAPTSGFLSNLVMYSFDRMIEQYCQEYGLRYTRYSDDIVLSSLSNNFSRDIALKTVSFVQKVCELNGFTLNKDKTRLMTPGSRKFVLGLMVDGNKLRLPKFDRQAIELAIYKYAKFGDSWSKKPDGRHELNGSRFITTKRLGPRDFPHVASNPKASLFGWLAYCKRVDLDFLERIHQKLSAGGWEFVDEGDFDELLAFTGSLLGMGAGSSEYDFSDPFVWKDIL